jgi:hypothetical protein
MRLLLGIGFIWTATLLAPFARISDGNTPAANQPGADPATAPTPNADPNWYYYDLGPFDPGVYRAVTIAEIVADPFRFDGQLISVQGALLAGNRPTPGCMNRPPSRTPTVEPGFVSAGGPISLTDPSGELGVLVWGKDGDSFGSQDELAVASGDRVELRGILRASYRSPACNPDRQMASAYLAIQRTDPVIPFKTAAQDIGSRLPPGASNDQRPLVPPASP